jgi:aryl-alcohol dehydrogenase-like predicted oxidoreductase
MRAMRYRTLGNTGLRCSVIGVGTWQFGGEWGVDFSQPQVDAILDTAGSCGINLIDTAECYGDHLSEKFIGDYLSRRDRTKWFIASKFGHHFNQFMNRTDDFSVAGVEKQLDASLKALHIETIDLYINSIPAATNCSATTRSGNFYTTRNAPARSVTSAFRLSARAARIRRAKPRRSASKPCRSITTASIPAPSNGISRTRRSIILASLRACRSPAVCFQENISLARRSPGRTCAPRTTRKNCNATSPKWNV